MRGSEAVWFSDTDRITASFRRSSVSITDRNGFGIGVPRLFVDSILSAVSPAAGYIRSQEKPVLMRVDQELVIHRVDEG